MAEAAKNAALIVLAGVPEMNQVLTLCGFANPVDRARLVEIEGLDTLDAFGDFSDDSIEHMARKYERPGPDHMRFGITRLNKMKSIAFWVRKQRREGIEATVDQLNEAVIRAAMREMTITTEEPKKDEKMFYPEKFNPKKYISWMRSFENYLDSVLGKSRVPLTYIIRPDDVVVDNAVDEYQRTIWSAPHTGYAFEEDNCTVYRIYKDVMVDTDGWTWFNRATNGNGRQAHQIITTHYRGTAETARRAKAEAMLERLHYKSEASFSFEKYVTKMNECFELLKDNDQDLAEAQKVKKLLNGVKTNHPEINALKTVVRTAHPTDFNAATTLMAGQIAVIFPAASIPYDTRPKRKISAANTTRGGRGRFERKKPPVMANGVDISDPNRSFTSDEWQKLRQGGLLSWVIEQRNQRGGRGGGGRGAGPRVRFQAGGRGNQDGGRGNNAGAGRNIAAVEHHQGNGNVPASQQNDVNTNAGRGGRTGINFGGGRYGAGRGRD
jgi:hypothetical protein